MAEIFKNAADIERKFNQHGYAMRRTALVKGSKEGAQLITDRAGDLAPRDTGELSREVVQSVPTSEASGAEVIVRIGPSMEAFYGMFQETGTAFFPAQPYLEPAAQEKFNDAVAVTNQVILDTLEALQ